MPIVQFANQTQSTSYSKSTVFKFEKFDATNVGPVENSAPRVQVSEQV